MLFAVGRRNAVYSITARIYGIMSNVNHLGANKISRKFSIRFISKNTVLPFTKSFIPDLVSCYVKTQLLF
jgi:hypothetical protein